VVGEALRLIPGPERPPPISDGHLPVGVACKARVPEQDRSELLAVVWLDNGPVCGAPVGARDY
jgi:hypothetical protein